MFSKPFIKTFNSILNNSLKIKTKDISLSLIISKHNFAKIIKSLKIETKCLSRLWIRKRLMIQLQIVGTLISRNIHPIKEKKSLMVLNIVKANPSIETQDMSEFMIDVYFFKSFILFFMVYKVFFSNDL